MTTLLGLILHLDVQLAALVAQHGAWVYLILGAVILIETGVVVMPFLPGDSLLFVAGALAAAGPLRLDILITTLTVAAIVGDGINFAIGVAFRKRTIDANRLRWIKNKHLDSTRTFFDRHGRKTIILARFVPVVRTLAPFVAALGHMPYRAFLVYNVIGGALWVCGISALGYYFGQVAWVQKNLTLVLVGIVILSVMPALFGRLNEKRSARKSVREH